ncbi:MAG: DedA family protein [Rhodococcus sp. (in: high G+C Gram-positive bacteria)]
MTTTLAALALTSAPVLLVGAGLVLAIEAGISVGLILPGSSTVLFVGALVGHGQLPFLPSVIVLAVASTFGAQLGFDASRRRSVRNSAPRFARSSNRVDAIRARAQRVFAVNADLGILLAHMVGGLRTLGPQLAARSAVSYRRFAVLNATAATVWVNILLLAGAQVGTNLDSIPWLILIAAVAAGVIACGRTVLRSAAVALARSA